MTDKLIETKKRWIMMYLNGRIDILKEMLKEDKKIKCMDAIYKRNRIRLETIESIRDYIKTQYMDDKD